MTKEKKTLVSPLSLLAKKARHTIIENRQKRELTQRLELIKRMDEAIKKVEAKENLESETKEIKKLAPSR